MQRSGMQRRRWWVTVLCLGVMMGLEVGRGLEALPETHLKSPKEERTTFDRIGRKVSTGAINVLTAVGELPYQTITETKRHWMIGPFWGPVKGALLVPVRLVSGAYDIFTCWLPIPPGYRPTMEARFADYIQ